jgi:hypothetical protein
MATEEETEVQFGELDEGLTEIALEDAPQDSEESAVHPLFPQYRVEDVASFSVQRGSKTLSTHLDPNCSEQELMAFLGKHGAGEYRVTPRLANGQRAETINRTVVRKLTPVEAKPAPVVPPLANDQILLKTIAHLRAASDADNAKARVMREKLESELETEARKFRRELDDQDRQHRSFRRKLEDEHLSESNRMRAQIRELEQERDALARKIREANDGTGVSQVVRDQIALARAEAELAPPASEFDGILAKGLEVLLPKLAGAFMGGSAASAPASDWKDPLAAPPSDEQH